MTHYVSHLEGAIDGTRLPFGRLAGLHAGRPIVVRYDLDGVRKAVTPAAIAARPPSLWRYRELLPLPFDVEPVVTVAPTDAALDAFTTFIVGPDGELRLFDRDAHQLVTLQPDGALGDRRALPDGAVPLAVVHGDDQACGRSEDRAPEAHEPTRRLRRQEPAPAPVRGGAAPLVDAGEVERVRQPERVRAVTGHAIGRAAHHAPRAGEGQRQLHGVGGVRSHAAQCAPEHKSPPAARPGGSRDKAVPAPHTGDVRQRV